jgi:hypothetical protein
MPSNAPSFVDDELLLTGLDVGDVGVFSQMGTGAGGGLDSHVRRQSLPAFSQRLGDQSGSEIVFDVAAQSAQCFSGLGGVNGASAAEADIHVGIKPD